VEQKDDKIASLVICIVKRVKLVHTGVSIAADTLQIVILGTIFPVIT